MRIVCSKELLIENINIVSRAVGTKSPMPILNSVLLTAEVDFRMMANDMKLGIETSPIDAQILETGGVALEAQMFFDIIRKMPDADVEIKSDAQNITTIKCGRTEFQIMGLNADEYPVLPDVEKNEAYSIGVSVLKNMIRQTIFSVSLDETRPILTGELLEFKNNVLSIVAIDGFRISYRKHELTYIDDISVVVPAKTLSELSRILPDDASEVKMYFTDKHTLFQFEKATVVSRLLDGDFMRYDQIFSNDYNTMVYADRSELLLCVDRATLISSRDGKKNPVRLQIEEDKIIVTSNTKAGASYEVISVKTDGVPLDIRFNPKYLTDALRAIDDGEVALQFTTVLSPCIIKGIEGDGYKYLVLPQRTL